VLNWPTGGSLTVSILPWAKVVYVVCHCVLEERQEKDGQLIGYHETTLPRSSAPATFTTSAKTLTITRMQDCQPQSPGCPAREGPRFGYDPANPGGDKFLPGIAPRALIGRKIVSVDERKAPAGIFHIACNRANDASEGDVSHSITRRASA